METLFYVLVCLFYLCLVVWLLTDGRLHAILRTAFTRQDEPSGSAEVCGTPARVRQPAYTPVTLRLIEALGAHGEAWFGSPVRGMVNARISDFMTLGDTGDRMRIGGWMIDLLVVDVDGLPLVALQLGRPPEKRDPYSGHAAREVLEGAGIPVIYLGDAPTGDHLGYAVRAVRKEGRLS